MRLDKPKSDNSRFYVSGLGEVALDKPKSEQSLKPWIDLGISQSTYYRHKKVSKKMRLDKPKSDNSRFMFLDLVKLHSISLHQNSL